jgi:hypothetical protein
MAFDMDANAITAAFKTAGYDDVNFSDVVLARRDDAKVREIVIDRGGRLKATITYQSGRPKETSVPVLDRKALVLTEKNTVVTVMFTLQDQSELPDVLKVIESLAH